LCGLCGILGIEEHWSEVAGRPETFAGRKQAPTRRQERLARISITNSVLAHYGLQLADWQGRSHLLKNKVGQTEVVDTIAAIWPVAAQLAGVVCDPLDPDLLTRLENEQKRTAHGEL
jgi:hypothetical protein